MPPDRHSAAWRTGLRRRPPWRRLAAAWRGSPWSACRSQLYKNRSSRKIYSQRLFFEENRTSQRPFLLLKISFPGRPIFIQFVPAVALLPGKCGASSVIFREAGLLERPHERLGVRSLCWRSSRGGGVVPVDGSLFKFGQGWGSSFLKGTKFLFWVTF